MYDRITEKSKEINKFLYQIFNKTYTACCIFGLATWRKLFVRKYNQKLSELNFA